MSTFGIDNMASNGSSTVPMRSASHSIKNEAVPLEQTTSDSSTDRPARNRLNGVVINGKTWTCATCKSGHRVGVCKHAGERPMRPTHAPGRPAAGAPKKVTCDCPKQCKCSHNCKCQRLCFCTQQMWILVHVPVTERNTNADREEWKIGEQVITDLRGNALTREQAEDYYRKKQAQKDQSSTSGDSVRSRASSSAASPAQAHPSSGGGCCSHKQAVTQERQAFNGHNVTNIQQLNVTPSASTTGCNCGVACACAFCPQHPNNPTSQNLARNGAVWLSQQQIPINQNFTQFSPNIPHEVSCMGGQPQFAVTRRPMQGNFANFGQVFPPNNDGGYMLAYPMGAMIPNTPQPQQQTMMPTFPPIPTMDPTLSMPPVNPIPGFDTTDDLFDAGFFSIGTAMVANDGPNGWEQHLTPDPPTFDFSDTMMMDNDYIPQGN